MSAFASSTTPAPKSGAFDQTAKDAAIVRRSTKAPHSNASKESSWACGPPQRGPRLVSPAQWLGVVVLGLARAMRTRRLRKLHQTLPPPDPLGAPCSAASYPAERLRDGPASKKLRRRCASPAILRARAASQSLTRDPLSLLDFPRDLQLTFERFHLASCIPLRPRRKTKSACVISRLAHALRQELLQVRRSSRRPLPSIARAQAE